MTNLPPIVAATRAARDRTGLNYATRVKAGRVQVVVARRDTIGSYTIEPVTKYGSLEDAVRFLDSATTYLGVYYDIDDDDPTAGASEAWQPGDDEQAWEAYRAAAADVAAGRLTNTRIVRSVWPNGEETTLAEVGRFHFDHTI